MKYKLSLAIASFCFITIMSGAQPAISYSKEMAKTVMALWKDSLAPKWAYDQGVVYDGLETLWKNTGDADYFNYIKKNIDYFVNEDGTIKTYDKNNYDLDNIKNGDALLLVYNVTGNQKYFKAASLLRGQLHTQPRTNEGGFWYKKIYPWQIWLDGLYMGEPFYAAYSKRRHDDTAFNDIANQFIYAEKHTRDTKTGLMYYGWDESKQQRWANKETGTSSDFRGSAMGRYGMALVDVLQNYPGNNPHKKELTDILNRYASAIIKVQDGKTGLWWDGLNFPNRQGNYFEASASCMFVYTMAKGVRLGYLPSTCLKAAEKGYDGIIQRFIVKDSNGFYNLNGTVSISELGTHDGYPAEKVVRNDLKAVGAFIQMSAEMEMLPTMQYGKGKTVLLDGYFNHEKKYDAASKDTIQYHYLWNEEDENGYSLLGHVFNKYGVSTKFLKEEVNGDALKKVNTYIIVDPDIPKEAKNPHYIEQNDINTISDWVKKGGTLLLLGNDSGNAEFTHFNMLAATFGIHFNVDSYNKVTGSNFEMGALHIDASNPIFRSTEKIYIKELSTLKLQSPAYAALTDKDSVIMAVSKYGKGTVFALGDPWLYNEYTDGRKLPKDFENYKAAEELVQWLIKQ